MSMPIRSEAQRLGRRAGRGGVGHGFYPDLRAFGHRRRQRGPDPVQRQSTMPISSMILLQAGPVRHRLGPHTVHGQQALFPARHQSGHPPHHHRTRSTIWAACAPHRRSTATCRTPAATMQFDEETWYFGLQPLGLEDADAKLLSRRHRKTALLQHAAGEAARLCSTRAPTTEDLSRPHRQRHRPRPRRC